MDDRELEGRLRAHLHRRFDDAPLPAGLAASVERGLSTTPAVVAPRLRPAASTGWSAIAAAVIVGVVAIAGLRFGWLLPAAPSPSASAVPTLPPFPTQVPPTERTFIVVPQFGTTPTQAQTSAAAAVLASRVTAFAGASSTVVAEGSGIQVVIPIDGPADSDVRRVLAATGDVSFVPLPVETYGEFGERAKIGEPLPTDEPALFGWEGIESVRVGEDQQRRPTLDIKLRTPAAAAFATHSAAHVGEAFAILVDGEVVSAPTISSPVPGGELSLTGGQDNPEFLVGAAILVGGILPEGWREAESPPILQREAIIESTLTQYRNEGVADVRIDMIELEVVPQGAGWLPVWRMHVDGSFAHSCPAIFSGESPCPDPVGGVVVRFDATNGIFHSSEPGIDP